MLAVYKILSPVAAGAFGLVGLLGEFRNAQSKKITSLGYVSILGIVASMTFGAWAGVVEGNQRHADEQEQLRQIQTAQLNLAATLEIIQNQKSEIINIERARQKLDRVDNPLGDIYPVVTLVMPESFSQKASTVILHNPQSVSSSQVELTVAIGDAKEIAVIESSDRALVKTDVKADWYWDSMPRLSDGGIHIYGGLWESDGPVDFNISRDDGINMGELTSWLDFKGKSITVACYDLHNSLGFCHAALSGTIQIRDDRGRSLKADHCTGIRNMGTDRRQFTCLFT